MPPTERIIPMINALSVERINTVAPYKVEMDSVTGSYDFVTDSGVHITVYFDEDLMITSGTSYQLIIGNANNKKSSRDNKLQKTILAIVEYNSNYSFHTTSIKDEDGITNFAALIIRNDNPLIVEIVSEFLETARALQQKP